MRRGPLGAGALSGAPRWSRSEPRPVGKLARVQDGRAEAQRAAQRRGGARTRALPGVPRARAKLGVAKVSSLQAWVRGECEGPGEPGERPRARRCVTSGASALSGPREGSARSALLAPARPRPGPGAQGGPAGPRAAGRRLRWSPASWDGDSTGWEGDPWEWVRPRQHSGGRAGGGAGAGAQRGDFIPLLPFLVGIQPPRPRRAASSFPLPPPGPARPLSSGHGEKPRTGRGWAGGWPWSSVEGRRGRDQAEGTRDEGGALIT